MDFSNLSMSDIFQFIYYNYFYYFLHMNDCLKYVYKSILDNIKSDKLKRSVYKIDTIDIDYLNTITIYKRPFTDIFFTKNIPYQIKLDTINNHKIPDFMLVTLWDNTTNLIKYKPDINLTKDLYNVSNKYIIVLIQAPIKLDITKFINNNSIFNGKDPIKLTNILLLMYYLKYIDNNRLIYLLCHVHNIVISTMDRNLNEKVMRYSELCIL